LLARGVIGVSKLSRSPTVKGGAVAIHVVWSRPPRPARIAAGFFAALALLAAGTRMAAIWIPVYVIGFLHAALLLRREIDIRLAWGGLYLVPLVICVVSEIHASNLGHEAWALQMDKDYRGAIGFYHRSLSYPQRASPVYPLLHIGQCYDALGEPDHAETYFKKAAAVSEEPGWGQYWLAWFYANRNWEKAGFYKPKEAAKILQSLVKSDAREAVRKTAAGLLDDLAHREGS
jgi:tetratricopeptide (TPR) repeat protein